MKRLILVVLLLALVPIAPLASNAQARKAERAEKAKDPVCGILVEKDPQLSHTHNGETYYFCSRADAEEFKKNPEKYAKK